MVLVVSRGLPPPFCVPTPCGHSANLTYLRSALLLAERMEKTRYDFSFLTTSFAGIRKDPFAPVPARTNLRVHGPSQCSSPSQSGHWPLLYKSIGPSHLTSQIIGKGLHSEDGSINASTLDPESIDQRGYGSCIIAGIFVVTTT